jgi:histone demethylase JARID1
MSNPIDDDMMKQDEVHVDQMFKEMTNQDEEDDKRNDVGRDITMTTASLENERNGMDALLDGE